MTSNRTLVLCLACCSSLMVDTSGSVATAEVPSTHLQQNPIYRDLLETGVTVDDASLQLVAPTMPDGLAAADQVKVIETLGGSRYPFEKFTRKSVVAPNIVRVPGVPRTATETPLRTVDFWFVVFAELDSIADPDVLGRLLGARQQDGRANSLTIEQLQARGIAIDDTHREHEAYGHLVYDLLSKVRISATGHSFWSRTDDSIIAAAKVDQRFEGDTEFPNRWSLLTRSGRETELGPPQPYDGLGFYAKITRLHRPAGAALVEFHLVFAEPVQWFRGTNQLGAKFPAIIQSQVRATRRELMAANKKR